MTTPIKAKQSKPNGGGDSLPHSRSLPMEKVREAVIKLASSNQKEPLSSSQIAIIDQRLLHSFPHGLRVPSHPTYASMIIDAIKDLSEERGSSEDSISEQVKANCNDLPWAHKSMLSHHLNRLCDEGLIILIASDRYTIPGFTQRTVLKKGRPKGKHLGMMKWKIACQENLKVELEPKVMNERELRSGRRRLVLQENEEELVGSDSACGKEESKMTSERVLRRGRRRLVLQENEEELVGSDSACGKEESKMTSERVLRRGRRRLVLQENEEELVGSDSACGKEESKMTSERVLRRERERRRLVLQESEEELVGNGCEELVVVEDKGENKGQEAQESEVFGKGGEPKRKKRLSPKHSISEMVKIRCRKRERKCDQLVNEGTEEKSLVDKCQDETRRETLTSEDDNIGKVLMNNGASLEIRLKKMKKNAEKLKICCSKRERKCDQLKSLVVEGQNKTRNETLALEDDNSGGDLMNICTSFETPVKKKEKDAQKVKIRRSKRGRKCDKMLTGGAEEKSSVDESVARNEILALEDDSNMNNGASLETAVTKKKRGAEEWTGVVVCGIAAKRRFPRQLIKSKEQPNKLIISTVNPLPSSELRECDNQQEASKSPKPIEPKFRVTRQLSVSKDQPNKLLISPVNSLPSSKIQEHDGQQEASIQSSQEAKINWPSWVQSLLETSFFSNCKDHANAEKSLCNLYCLDCKNGALCTSCLASHDNHHVIKINQAFSEDAVDISDIETHVDISGIRTHKLNAGTLIILDRIICSGRTFAGNVAHCLFCQRPVPSPFDFCTLKCKYEQRMAGSAPCKIK